MRFAYRCATVVTACLTAAFASSLVLAEEQQMPLRRLDDATRAKVLAALAGLIILGFGMVLLTWLAARFVQRYRRGSWYLRPTPRPGEHAWAKKPLIPPRSDPPATGS